MFDLGLIEMSKGALSNNFFMFLNFGKVSNQLLFQYLKSFFDP